MTSPDASAGRPGALPPVLIGLLLLAAALRLPACFSDFWLDEVWSLLLAQELDSPFQVFTRIRHDNNHPLNTLVLYALGDRDQWIVYRLHALAAGIALVALAWRIGADGGRREAQLAATLTAGSYLLIHFSSEARGYSLALCFGFASWLAVQRFAADPRWRTAIPVWLFAALGFLSHLLYVHVFVAAGVWLALRLAAEREPPARALREFVRGYAPPIAIALLFDAFFVRGMMIGGGPRYALLPLLVKTASYAAGGPARGPLAVAFAFAFAGACGASILHLRRRGCDAWIFFATVIFLSPLALLVHFPPQVLFVRYFLVSVAFGLLAVAHGLAELARGGARRRALVVALVLILLAANARHVLRLWTLGRGGYRAAVVHMAERSPGPVIAVASDDDVANKMLLVYYQRFLPPGKRLRYVDRSERPARPPPWRIRQSVGRLDAPEATIRDDRGNVYELERSYPHADLSGHHWLLYRLRAPRAPRR